MQGMVDYEFCIQVAVRRLFEKRKGVKSWEWRCVPTTAAARGPSTPRDAVTRRAADAKAAGKTGRGGGAPQNAPRTGVNTPHISASRRGASLRHNWLGGAGRVTRPVMRSWCVLAPNGRAGDAASRR
jgi:hypothetical protein